MQLGTLLRLLRLRRLGWLAGCLSRSLAHTRTPRALALSTRSASRSEQMQKTQMSRLRLALSSQPSRWLRLVGSWLPWCITKEAKHGGVRKWAGAGRAAIQGLVYHGISQHGGVRQSGAGRAATQGRLRGCPEAMVAARHTGYSGGHPAW